jgi:hypothetical protein
MDTSKVLYAPQILATIASLRVVDSGNACHRQRESMPLGAKFAPIIGNHPASRKVLMGKACLIGGVRYFQH